MINKENLVHVPIRLKARKDDKTILCVRWKFSKHYESFYVAYRLINNSYYQAFEIELVYGHWGIQRACYGDWDYKSPLLARHEEGFLVTHQIEKHNEPVDSLVFDIEESNFTTTCKGIKFFNTSYKPSS